MGNQRLEAGGEGEDSGEERRGAGGLGERGGWKAGSANERAECVGLVAEL